MPAILWAQPHLHHHLQVRLQPEHHALQATDVITLPEQAPRRFTFQLRTSLTLILATSQQTFLDAKTAPASPDTTRYTVELPADSRTVTLTYRGAILHAPQQQSATYNRDFSETPGTIAPAGVYLGSTSAWYPQVMNHLLTFRLDVQLPKDWDAVSQGKRTLPSYGTYSYLGFSGDKPTNIAKGQWPVLQSPMTVQLPQADGQLAPVTRAKLPSQPPLATLPAAFSAKP